MSAQSGSGGSRTFETAPNDWAKALDQFEQRLVEFRSVLDNGRPAEGLWPPPWLIGVPLPAEHADRARALLARANELEGELRTKRDALPTLRRTGPSYRTTPHSSFLTEL